MEWRMRLMHERDRAEMTRAPTRNQNSKSELDIGEGGYG
jgi:hypothetical protein